MKTQFPEYFQPTTKEFQKLWDDAIIAIDTNILTNLYRYSDITKNELLRILDLVAGKTWLPHQVAKEFLRNRRKANSLQINDFTEPEKKIQDFEKEILALSQRRRHPFISSDVYTQLTQIINKVKDELESQRVKIKSRMDRDDIFEQVVDRFLNNIGNESTQVILESIAKEGKSL